MIFLEGMPEQLDIELLVQVLRDEFQIQSGDKSKTLFQLIFCVLFM